MKAHTTRYVWKYNGHEYWYSVWDEETSKPTIPEIVEGWIAEWTVLRMCGDPTLDKTDHKFIQDQIRCWTHWLNKLRLNKLKGERHEP